MFEGGENVLVTGGSGFIGNAFIRKLLLDSKANVFNLDKVSNRNDLISINSVIKNNILFEERYTFFKADLLNSNNVKEVVEKSDPDYVFHFAAETHVDRSINHPKDYVLNNVVGTFNLLEIIRKHYEELTQNRKNNFIFHHVSTDEVFGSLGLNGKFKEDSHFDPKSPYSATKASSDHLVNAWFHTYGLPVITTNCSNNYGPWQFPEKFIPLVILKAINSENIPLYGKGENIREWLHVDDHIDAILLASKNGKAGRRYLVGSNNELTNKELVEIICGNLDMIKPQKKPYSSNIVFVEDRPGHDFRYSLDSSLIRTELGWEEKTKIEDGLKKTIVWYLNNLDWCERVRDQSGYNGERLGLL